MQGNTAATYTEKAQVIGHRKVWGQNSLTLGEMICFAAGALIIFKQVGGKYSLPLGLAIMGLGMALF